MALEVGKVLEAQGFVLEQLELGAQQRIDAAAVLVRVEEVVAERLDDVIGGGLPNQATGKVDWSHLKVSVGGGMAVTRSVEPRGKCQCSSRSSSTLVYSARRSRFHVAKSRCSGSLRASRNRWNSRTLRN